MNKEQLGASNGMDEFKKTYPALHRHLEAAKEKIHALIVEELGKIGHRYLLRMRLTESRPKKLHSLIQKAKRYDWKPDEILKKMQDVLGFRIVCSNIEDVYRIKDALGRIKGLKLREDLAKNQVSNPSDSGYRAYHMYFEYMLADAGLSHPILCEIQIRTMLQDAWAVLSHDDLYKNAETVSKDLKKLSKRLSELLSVADQIAQDIREQVSQPLSGKAPDGAVPEVSKDALAFIFHRHFGKDPSAHYIDYAIKVSAEAGVYRLDTVERVLDNEPFLKKSKELFTQITNWECDDETLFEVALCSATNGLEAGLSKVKIKATEFAKEIEGFYRSEFLSSLPPKIDAFIKYISDERESLPDILYQYAKDFDALNSCAICECNIIDVETFVENILEFYMEDENETLREKISSIVYNSGAECGGENGDICSYHEDALRRPD